MIGIQRHFENEGRPLQSVRLAGVAAYRMSAMIL
jgi:hypothetical protein